MRLSARRLISVLLSLSITGGVLTVDGFVSAEDTVRPTAAAVQTGFESGLNVPFSMSTGDDGTSNSTGTVLTSTGKTDRYAHLPARSGSTSGAVISQSVLSTIKSNGASGKYYISARIKLDNAGDTAYAEPYIQGGTLQQKAAAGEYRFPVSGSWTAIGKTSDGTQYLSLSNLDGDHALTTDHLNSLTWCFFSIQLYKAAAGQGYELYDGGYSIDDVVLWFVPGSGSTAVTEVGSINVLKYGDFENDAALSSDAWSSSKDGYSAEIRQTNAIRSHSGSKLLYVTDRAGGQSGLVINMTDIVHQVGTLDTAAGESYTIRLWMRAERGESFDVQPIFGSSVGNGYLTNIESRVTVTDQWTEVGVNVRFNEDYGNTIFDPSGCTWAGIRFKTTSASGGLNDEVNVNYYVDDVTVSAPENWDKAVIGSDSFQPGAYYGGPELTYRSSSDQTSAGVWWWNASLITVSSSGVDVDHLLDFLIQNHVNEIYFCIDKMTPYTEQIAQGGQINSGYVSEADVRGFVAKCKRFGIRVAALSGDSSWLNPADKDAGLNAFEEKFDSYQLHADTDEKFYGMHLDIEPSGLAQFSTCRPGTMQWMADLTSKIADDAKNKGTVLEWDIPFWLTDQVSDPNTGESLTLGELMAEYCDTVTVMAYRDTASAMMSVSSDEMAYAKKYSHKIVLGAETLSEDSDQASYAEEGKNGLIAQFTILRGLLDSSGLDSYGVAVHDCLSWYNLADGAES